MPAAQAERDGIDRATERLVAALGAERFAAAFEAGNGLSPGEARALVG